MVTATDRDLDVRLYSVKRLAELCEVSVSFIYDEIKAGRLPTVQLGNGDRNKLRVRAKDVRTWQDERLSTNS